MLNPIDYPPPGRTPACFRTGVRAGLLRPRLYKNHLLLPLIE